MIEPRARVQTLVPSVSPRILSYNSTKGITPSVRGIVVLSIFTLCFLSGAVVLSLLDLRLGVAMALLGYAFIPFAAEMVRIGPILLHPSAIVVFVVTVVNILRSPYETGLRRPTLPEGVPHGAVILLALSVTGMVINELTMSAVLGQSAAYILNQVVAPIALLGTCCSITLRHPSFYRRIVLGFAAVAVIQSILVLLISRGLISQPFEDELTRNYWWSLISRSDRQMGTTDHPLNLALLIAAAVPLLALVERTWLRATAFLLLLGGVALTQSRIGILAVVAGALYLVMRGAGAQRTKFPTIVGVAVASIALYQYGLFQPVLERLSDDSGSSAIRINSWQLLIPRWDRFFGHGEGISSIKPYMTTLVGFESTPESAFLGYVLAYGLIITLMFFGSLIWLAISQIRRCRAITPGSFALLVTLCMVQFFSSITNLTTSTAIILWLTVYLSVAAPVTNRVEPVSASYARIPTQSNTVNRPLLRPRK